MSHAKTTSEASLRILPAALLALAVFGASSVARATTYYVAPTGGSDSGAGAGTMTLPFATVGRAQTAAVAGDTVIIRGGTFAFSGSGTVGVAFSKSGTAAQPINYFAFPGETPIFDLDNLTPSNRVTGLDVHCSFIHLRGLAVRGVHQYMEGMDSWGVRIQGNNNVLEQLDVHDNDAPGIFITSGSNNQVLNCDSHANYDFLEGGGSGDGFGCHSAGGGNVFSGCRAYDNSDDGFDFINAAGSCTVEHSFSFRNGWQPGTTVAAGNGAGFKSGGYGSPPDVPATGAATHTVQNCVAFGNRAQGFYGNHHPGRINFYNNTAFNNPANFNMTADAGFPSSHVLRNNVAMATGSLISSFTGGTDNNNSWTPLMPAAGSTTTPVTVSSADFVNLMQSEVLNPRQADGSLPTIGFAHLAAGSDLIDHGIDVGLSFAGAAPDLGAFEFGTTTSGQSGSGGAATNSGGASGTHATGGGSQTGGTGGVRTASGGSTSGGGANAVGGSAVGGSAVGGGANPGSAGTSAGGSAGTVLPSGSAGASAAGAGDSPAAAGAADQAGCSCRMPAGRRSLPEAYAGLALLGLLCAFAKRARRKNNSGARS